MRINGIFPCDEDLLVVVNKFRLLLRGREYFDCAFNQRHGPLLRLLHIVSDIADHEEEGDQILCALAGAPHC